MTTPHSRHARHGGGARVSGSWSNSADRRETAPRVPPASNSRVPRSTPIAPARPLPVGPSPATTTGSNRADTESDHAAAALRRGVAARDPGNAAGTDAAPDTRHRPAPSGYRGIPKTLRLAAVAALCVLPALLSAQPARAQERGRGGKKAALTPEAAVAAFKAADGNRDGRLTRAELGKAVEPWIRRFDRDGDDVVRRKELDTVMGRPQGLRKLVVLRDARARAVVAMRLDRDKSGTVSREEYPGETTVFRSADRNRDGELTWRELVRLAHDELEDIGRRARSPSRYEMFALFDLDGNRSITRAEYDGPARAFRKYDEDGDGTIAYVEIYPQTMEEYEEPPKLENVNALAAMDTDGDGRVSRKEWKGTEAAWQRIDRNGDGWLTRADAR